MLMIDLKRFAKSVNWLPIRHLLISVLFLRKREWNRIQGYVNKYEASLESVGKYNPLLCRESLLTMKYAYGRLNAG